MEWIGYKETKQTTNTTPEVTTTTPEVTQTDESMQESSDGTFMGNVNAINAQDNDKAQEVKEEITQEELKEESPVLKAPLNWTDPIVWHDPSLYKGIIIKQVETDRGDREAASHEQTSHLIDGVYFPLIKINQRLIPNDDIIYMKLSSTDLFPTLFLIIHDKNGSITNLNSTGINSEIIVVITAPVNGVYKKIKLPFYIDSVDSNTQGNNDHVLIYNCSIKIPILKQKYPRAMNFPDSNQWYGCTICKQPKQKQPNSWEMLHYIADECKLGFASTDKCKEISDRYWRLLHTYPSLENALAKEKEYAGTDEEDAVFDWWIDFYGYLVMVNLPWVLKEEITTEHLSIYAITGIQPTSEQQTNPKPKVQLVNRTLSNSKDTTSLAQNHNLMIRNYEIVTDNSLYDIGTCSSFNIYKPIGAGGTNGVTQTDVQVEELSVDGFATEQYTTHRTFMRSVDMSGIDKQLKISLFDRYFKSKRAKQLVVELENFNLGLQRGTLVNIVIMESNPQNKATITNNLDNIVTNKNDNGDDAVAVMPASENLENGEVADDSPTKSEMIKNEAIEIVNHGISGLYYIDGITFEFDSKKEQRIYQKLYLIKKGVWGNYSSVSGNYKVNDKLPMNPPNK